MKKSYELYARYNELIRDAKDSIKTLSEKQPEKTIMFNAAEPWIIVELWEGCDKVLVKGVTISNGVIRIICDGFVLNPEDVISSEWLYLLECVEYELEEKEWRV